MQESLLSVCWMFERGPRRSRGSHAGISWPLQDIRRDSPGSRRSCEKASDSQEHMVTEVDGEQTGAGIDSGKKG